MSNISIRSCTCAATGGNFDGEGHGQFSGAEFALLDRKVRGSAREVGCARRAAGAQGRPYTACPPGNDDWQLRADDIALNQKTRIGTGQDVRLEFIGVPILYLPWISFPVGDQRKTGMLFPIIGTSGNSGHDGRGAVYWNIAPNRDATLTTRYYIRRGLRLDPEFRYLTDSSRGVLTPSTCSTTPSATSSRSLFEWRHATRLNRARGCRSMPPTSPTRTISRISAPASRARA